jgi:hypothetical protein
MSGETIPGIRGHGGTVVGSRYTEGEEGEKRGEGQLAFDCFTHFLKKLLVDFEDMRSRTFPVRTHQY